MCHKLDNAFFERLETMSPADVCRRSLAEYDPDSGAYRITALGEPYEVEPSRKEIRRVGTNAKPPTLEMGLTILFYLLESKEIPITGKWISEKEIPGGITFFQGPHAFPGPKITSRFGNDTAAFGKAAMELGGKPADMGDASYLFKILPRVPIAAVYWRGDDEFGPECKFLMDSTIHESLPLDVIFGMVIEFARRLTGLQLKH